MTDKNYHDIVLSLAGVFQAASLVEQLARTGLLPQDAFTCSINSLLTLNANHTADIFSEGDRVNLGLSVLKDFLVHHRSSNYQDSLRYVLGILHLQKKMMRRKDMLNVVASRIQQASRQAEHFGNTHDNVIANLASLYTETISTFKFRIQVLGDPNQLTQQRTANQVRVLLFAGIRAATAWRQAGGSRWQIMLSRKKLTAITNQLIAERTATAEEEPNTMAANESSEPDHTGSK